MSRDNLIESLENLLKQEISRAESLASELDDCRAKRLADLEAHKEMLVRLRVKRACDVAERAQNTFEKGMEKIRELC